MKRLALALILVLALGSVAYAVTPTLSTAVELSGSETWSNGALSANTNVATATTKLTLSASGTGYTVTAYVDSINAGVNINKYTAKLTDGKYVFDIWGNTATTSDFGTLFGKIKAVKESVANWRLRSTYEGGKVVADINNADKILKAFGKTQLSADTTVGAAIEKDLTTLNNTQGNVDVWATTKAGIATVSGELIVRNVAATAGLDSGDLFLQVKAPVAGFNTTSSIEYRTKQTWIKKYNNTNVNLTKGDLTINAIMTNKDNKVQLLKFNAKKDPGLRYIFGEFTKNMSKVNLTTDLPTSSNVLGMSAEFGIRGSNDQGWGDVFSTSSDKWLNNKTWVAVLKAANVMASTAAADGSAIATDTNPALTASAEGVYCVIPKVMWAHGLATLAFDKDVNAKADIDISANARHKYALTSKIALDSNAAIAFTDVGQGTAKTSGSIGTTATYTLASNMNVYASVSEAMISTGSPTNTLKIGYSIKF